MIRTAKYYTEVILSLVWRPYVMGAGECAKKPEPRRIARTPALSGAFDAACKRIKVFASS